MPLVSVTRLRVRSFLFLPGFLFATYGIYRQLRRSSGFVAGTLTLELPRAFWTITVWDSEASMRAFRNGGPHQRAMPRLLSWCDEASYAHWGQPEAAMPSLDSAFERLRTDGRISKVLHPTTNQLAGRTTSAKKPLPGRVMGPIRGS
jgi:hypothetical protein